ncbi:glycosyltransferase [Pseudofrancisella aestuarii]|uniref:Glycosyltransferase n=1 Tax=Pseudofrancisella aestuarii TaxID=2670347 RepID=A0ABV9TD56_9GAMM|nr:glycosyltransferase [Pseudofrancisella aestuarii]
MKKIKILHVYKTDITQTKGGIEAFIDNLCNATEDLGVENIVFSLANKTSYPNFITYGKYKIYHAKKNLEISSAAFSLSAFYIFRKLIKEVDIVHYIFPNPFGDVLHTLCNIKKPTIITYQSDIVKQKRLLKFYQPLMYRFLKSANKIVCTSPNYLKTSDTLLKFKEKVEIIPIGIDIKTYPSISSERIRYWKSKLPEKYFLFIGKLRYYKGLYTAIDAVYNTSIQLVICGNGFLEKELKEYAFQKSIKNVHFINSFTEEDKVAILTLCYGFVFPSQLRSEAFGISLLEGAAFGKPLISCEIGTGTTYINLNDITGLVINPNSPELLKEAMLYLLNNPKKAEKFGENSKNRAKNLFSLELQAKSYINLYKELIRL